MVKISNMLISASIVASVDTRSRVVQNIVYYLFHFHIQLVPTALLLPESSQWILGVETGRVGINGVMTELYRPSAFFLEPSHMFLYVFPILYIVLLSPGINKLRIKLSIFLSLGLILTTSGMGICITAFAWLLYFGLNDGKNNIIELKNLLSRKKIFILVILCLIIVVMIFFVPTLRQSFNRILSGEAITGRTSQANNLIESLEGQQLIIGVTNSTAGIAFNLSGFAATLYKFGIIGIILSYAFYVRSTIELKAPYNWIGLVILIVSFFSAHTHGTIYMLYYVLILLNGYKMGYSKNLKEVFKHAK